MKNYVRLVGLLRSCVSFPFAKTMISPQICHCFPQTNGCFCRCKIAILIRHIYFCCKHTLETIKPYPACQHHSLALMGGPRFWLIHDCNKRASCSQLESPHSGAIIWPFWVKLYFPKAFYENTFFASL